MLGAIRPLAALSCEVGGCHECKQRQAVIGGSGGTVTITYNDGTGASSASCNYYDRLVNSWYVHICSETGFAHSSDAECRNNCGFMIQGIQICYYGDDVCIADACYIIF